MVVPMLRPDVFGALATHAGDALFEACYLPEFPQVARALRDEFDGSWDAFFERAPHADPPKWEWIELLETYGYAAAYSPDPANPGRALIPFDVHGRLIEDVWAQWLEQDPVRMAPRHADALRSMRRIYLDAGKQRRVLPRPRRAGLRAPSSTSWASRTRSSSSTARTRG